MSIREKNNFYIGAKTDSPFDCTQSSIINQSFSSSCPKLVLRLNMSVPEALKFILKWVFGYLGFRLQKQKVIYRKTAGNSAIGISGHISLKKN